MRWCVCAARHRRFCQIGGAQMAVARKRATCPERAQAARTCGRGLQTRWSPAGRLLLWRELRYYCRCAPASWSYGPVVEWYDSMPNSATSAACNPVEADEHIAVSFAVVASFAVASFAVASPAVAWMGLRVLVVDGGAGGRDQQRLLAQLRWPLVEQRVTAASPPVASSPVAATPAASSAADLRPSSSEGLR